MDEVRTYLEAYNRLAAAEAAVTRAAQAIAQAAKDLESWKDWPEADVHVPELRLHDAAHSKDLRKFQRIESMETVLRLVADYRKALADAKAALRNVPAHYRDAVRPLPG